LIVKDCHDEIVALSRLRFASNATICGIVMKDPGIRFVKRRRGGLRVWDRIRGFRRRRRLSSVWSLVVHTPREMLSTPDIAIASNFEAESSA
jgi:hypothetical protein